VFAVTLCGHILCETMLIWRHWVMGVLQVLSDLSITIPAGSTCKHCILL
jgi:hypothetical protein